MSAPCGKNDNTWPGCALFSDARLRVQAIPLSCSGHRCKNVHRTKDTPVAENIQAPEMKLTPTGTGEIVIDARTGAQATYIQVTLRASFPSTLGHRAARRSIRPITLKMALGQQALANPPLEWIKEDVGRGNRCYILSSRETRRKSRLRCRRNFNVAPCGGPRAQLTHRLGRCKSRSLPMKTHCPWCVSIE